MNIKVPGQGKVIGFYGKDAQTVIHMEECAELIQAISKIHRIGCGPDIPPDAYRNLVEEIADVLVIIEQLQEIYEIPDHELQWMIDYKCARQGERMNGLLCHNLADKVSGKSGGE